MPRSTKHKRPLAAEQAEPRGSVHDALWFKRSRAFCRQRLEYLSVHIEGRSDAILPQART